MADRAEMFSLSTFHSLSPPGCRPSHDISLEEFDDEDLSEITDDCGIGLNYDSDPYEKDSLILEKNDIHHPVCSFQDDFQEFEMIDDEDEDDEEEEDVDPDAPPSPSASPSLSPTLGTVKSRPTTLNLTAAVSQDSLNNNSSLSPKKGSWQDSLRNPASQGRLSPTHSCLVDGSHVTGQCPASPVSQAPGSQSKGTPPKQAGEGGNPQSPHRPLLCDVEGNRRERPEYGSFGHHRSHPGSTDFTEPKTDPSIQTARVPSLDEHSQCSDTEVDHDLNSDHNHKHSNRRPTDTYTITSESGMEQENDLDPDGTSHCLSSTAPMGANDGADTPLSDEELEKDFEVEFMCKETYDIVCKENQLSYVEFPSIEPHETALFSSYQSSSRSEALDQSNSSEALSLSATVAGANDSTSPSSDPGIADMNQQGYMTSDQDKDLSSPGSDSDVEGELEAAFSCGGPVVSNMISSISETELDLTSDESSSGRSSHLTNSIEEASSPTSDQELDPDTELEQDSGIVGLKASLLLGQPDPIKEGSLVPSPSPLPSPTIATPSPIDSPILPPEPYDDDQALMGLQSVDDELSCEHQADPDETLPPTQCCEDHMSRPMVLEIEPDHGLESFKRSFYLPVGPRLMPSQDDYDETSEGDSESESEDDLSENSDSPWLLSNLVNRMISEGSYPISCPEECFQRKASVSDTISPSSDIGEGDSFNDEVQETKADMKKSQGRDKEGEGYQKENVEPTRSQNDESSNEGALISSQPYTSNPAAANSPLILECCAKNERGTIDLNPVYTAKDCDKNSTGKQSKNAWRQEDEEPNNDLMMLEGRRDLDSPSLSESVISDKDEGRETEPRPTSRSTASLERITEVKHSLTLDIPSAQTNRCFSLTYSTDNDEEEEEDGDSYPFLGSLRKQSYNDSDLELDSSPPIDSSVHNHSLPDHDLPLCEKDLALRQPNEDDGLAYDSMKYTLVVDENTTLELVSLRRCTSVLSDESELSTPCDGETLGIDDVDYVCKNAEVRPDLLSSSEDSSPEADLPFSKKFLNVFVNSTSRSSSTESFGLFSCTINGEERDQTHRAVYRFIPRHADELELDVDDPLYVEEEEDDYWYRGYNMRTGEKGIFPGFYAQEVISQSKELLGLKRNPAWIETFSVQFLGSVEVPYHQGNGILCAAMQKIAISRKRTVHVRPPSLCELEISLQGVKLIMSLEDEYDTLDEFDRCSHFFQMKNISFCGCHPRNNCYFGFITKHPMLNRFACHVFVSQESMRPVAECVGRAFQEYYQEHLEYACPTEDIYLE
ncbi:C-Jun-amino-terminal kinase-interacting protein 2 isoform X2 [Austrofundulus limnaeus]|uniref:C-Jun-amino-terminal kinase-interacting protein 2 isoform X2 n=1 Tax=Austrofundulus limnaeus TaxID=52670 RepID=A0A2I4BJ54_AUSLI|nr:PREDICTED: C-Jun-amino-terminal kinase-interacting protein 2-like isoform X2 [Austrofundulus limnaeus]